MPAFGGVPRSFILASILAAGVAITALAAMDSFAGYEIVSKARFGIGALAAMGLVLVWDAHSRARSGALGKETAHADAVDATDQLVRQLDEAVALAKLKKPQRVEPIELDALFTRAAKRHGRTDVIVMRSPVHTRGERNAITKLFDILIANALRSGSRAVVSMDHGTTFASVHVDDDGPGVPRAQRERIFEMPPRRGASRAAAHEMSYAEARHIARAHGGNLLVSSSPQGGARFTVHLPLHAVAAEHEAAAVA
jgi:signal transduction histidine kinase